MALLVPLWSSSKSRELWDAPDMQADRSRRTARSGSRWAAIARVGLAYWFFGNLYEAMVDVPRLLADARLQRPPGLLGPGSPVRYYAPAAPLTLAATIAALIEGWCSHGDKRVITAGAASMTTATAVTAYLARTVNRRLLRGDEPLSASERHELITSWHRANLVRLAAVATTSVALRQTARPGSGMPRVVRREAAEKST